MANKHFGFWVFGKDMTKVKLEDLKKYGVTDIFLNYYAFTAHGESKVLAWIKKAKTNGMNTHIWMQCFYDGEWINPATNKTIIDKKLKEAKKYANLAGVKGVHLDYLRYPGNANKTSGGTTAITNFVKKVRSQNPKTFLSCAVMPENEDDKKYYGQDIPALGKIVDCIIPMQYKGNYEAGSSWLQSTTKYFAKYATIWSGLQSYKSDDDTTLLSTSALTNDVKTCLNAGAKGAILFRYGLSNNVNFKQFQPKTVTISPTDIKIMALTVKTYIEKNKKIPSQVTINGKKYTYGQIEYILAYAVNNYNKAAKVFTVKNAPKATGDVVSEKIYADDFKDISKRIVAYIEKNKVCPNYATTKKSKKRLRVRVVIYMLARVVNYLYTKKKLPTYATVKSSYFSAKKTTTKTTVTKTTSTPKLYSYLTNEGCSGMGQCTGYNCGPNSLQQMFYRLTGIKVSESAIAEVAGTTGDGTDHDGLNTAVSWFNRKYNKNIKITWKNFSDLGSSASARWSALQSYINKGAVFVHLLYRDQWGHYEVPKSVGDDYLSIINSLGDYCSYPAYCGYIETRSKSAQLSYINGISQKSIAILTNG